MKSYDIRLKTLMTVLSVALFAALVPFSALFAQESVEETPPESRWESTIQGFERADRETPYEPGGVLFLGSSSIRMWDLEKSFPELGAVNRGFGGSEISDSIEFFDRIVEPRAPRLIVFYAGDNDIAKGKSPEQVSDDFKTFLAMIRKELPETRIVFVAIKPSIARWNLIEKNRDANARVVEQIEKDDLADFLDIDAPMINEEGLPNSDLFLGDGLHLNEKGYAIWNRLLKPLLEEPKEEE
jgi:lysophospholipase L1-like esterase